jgi:hypothetical protein
MVNDIDFKKWKNNYILVALFFSCKGLGNQQEVVNYQKWFKHININNISNNKQLLVYDII